MLKNSTPGTDDATVDDIKQKYDDVVKSKENYVTDLKKAIAERDLDKEDIFKESTLNIKLSKFKGYGSATDIYTFKSDFEKLYLRATPKRLLPDLLKNNYLDGSALYIFVHFMYFLLIFPLQCIRYDALGQMHLGMMHF